MNLKSALVACAALATLAAHAQMGTPVPDEVKQLVPMVGTWTGKAKFHMMGEASEGPVKVTNSMAVGGRYLEGHHEYEMPGMGKFFGLQMLTYDAAKEEWLSYWFDSTESGAMEMRGKKVGDWYVLTGKYSSEGMEMEMRNKFKIGEGTLSMSLEMKMGDEWTPLMEAEYKKG